MPVDLTEVLKKTKKDVDDEIERLNLKEKDDKLLDQTIKEYEAKIYRMQLAIDDPKTDPEKRDILITKIQNRTFAYYAMTEHKKVK